jgi:hypothetical protein
MQPKYSDIGASFPAAFLNFSIFLGGFGFTAALNAL